MERRFIHLAYIISQFGIEIYKIRYFTDHFSRSLESNREQPLHNAVNVWDQIASRDVTLPRTVRMVRLWLDFKVRQELLANNNTF